MLRIRQFTQKYKGKGSFVIAVIKSNTIGIFSKRDFIVIAFFTLLGVGGVFASAFITVSSTNFQGAGYSAVISCDDAVTIDKNVVFNTDTRRYLVTTISLSDIDQRFDINGVSGCGGRDLQLAIEENGTVQYTSWSIPIDLTGRNNTFTFGSATGSSSYQSRSIFASFDATALENLAVTLIPGTSPPSFTGLKWYKISDNAATGLGNTASGIGYTYCSIDTNNGLEHQDEETGINICGDGINSPKDLVDDYTYYWSGYILWPSSTNNYVCFRSSNDDGFMLKINSNVTINDNTAHAATLYDGAGGVSGLSANNLYPIEAWLHEIGGGSAVQLYWNTQVTSCSKTSTAGDTLIPATNLLGQ